MRFRANRCPYIGGHCPYVGRHGSSLSLGELTTFLAEFPAFSGWTEGAADEEADDPRDFYTEGGFRLGGTWKNI